MSDVASKLLGLELTSSKGEKVRLGSLWTTRASVLVFIRHFG